MDMLNRAAENLQNEGWDEEAAAVREAADEIERLRKDYALAWENHLLHEQIFVLTEAKIERLREALRHMLRWHDQLSPADIAKAKAALKEGE